MSAPHGPLVPRMFQREALEEALRRNVIIRADTGSGKTLIAVMLIRAMAALGTNEGRLLVFLTPTVSLVHQQADVLREQTLLRVKEFVGAHGVDFWRREKWQEQLGQADAVVLTPQIFLDVLSKAYWPMDKVSLIVVDESHNAGKKHPYAEIMRQHYHPRKAAGQLVPRILGLTASPLFNLKNPDKAIRDFEQLLDSRILEITKDHKVEMQAYSPRAIEQLVEHPPQAYLADIELSVLIAELKQHVELEESWADRIEAARTLFGFAGVRILAAYVAREYRAPPLVLAKLEACAAATVPFSALSTKVQKLVEVLQFAQNDEFHAIIFCQMRHHAVVLSILLNRVPSLASWLKSKPLVGHGGRGRPVAGEQDSANDTGMLAKELNCIVATRVAEEGLDFRRCNLVVRFDALTTLTGYIQSRGRARAASARFVVLAETGSPDAAKYLEYVKQEKAMVDLYGERPSEEDADAEAELDNLPTYTTTTGALLTHSSAIPTLAQFCQLLVKPDPFIPLQNPHYSVIGVGNGPWTAELKLPRVKALGRTVFFSDPMPSKRSAKQNAAFQACIELHRAGGLDDYLMPYREPLEGFVKDADGREVDRSGMPKSIEVVFPNVFGNAWLTGTSYLHIVELNHPRSQDPFRVGLVCASSAVSTVKGQIYSREGRLIAVNVIKTHKLQWATADEQEQRLNKLDCLNRTSTRILLNRRISEDRSFAFWTPVTNDGEIDWLAVEEAFDPFETEKVKHGDLLVVSPFRRPTKRIGTFVSVRRDVTSSSRTRDVEIEPPRKKHKMMERYSEYWLYAKVCYDHHDIGPDSNEAIVEIAPFDLEPYNALVPPKPDFTQVGRSSIHVRTFPASMIQTTILPLEWWEAFTLVPSLNFLILSQLHAQRALKTFHFPPIPVERLAEALTAPRCQAGTDLEFLETVGDSALKLATSVHIYLEYPTAEEERLTRIRMNSVDNRFLRQRCLESGYASVIIPHLLRTTTFLPYTSDDATLSSDGLYLKKKIPRLLLCDSVEATLGAAVATGGIEMAIQAGDKLGLCFGGTKPWGEREKAKVLLDVESTKAGPGLRSVEEKLGYTFEKQGALLLTALTHRSYAGGGDSYERLEYLGDAILDFWCTSRLFSRAPTATPRDLTYKRALLVSNGVLALLSLRVLELHKAVLHSSAALEQAMQEASEKAAAFGWRDVVEGGLTWLWQPPKVLGDVLEAILAAIFIDSGLTLEPVFAVLDRLYAEIMPLLEEGEVRDPFSKFLMFRDSHGCQQMGIRLTRVDPSDPSTLPNSAHVLPRPSDAAAISKATEPYYLAQPIFHSSSSSSAHALSFAPARSSSKQVAKQLAARSALDVLEALAKEKKEKGEEFCGCRRETRERVERAKREAEGKEAGEEGSEAVDGSELESEEAEEKLEEVRGSMEQEEEEELEEEEKGVDNGEEVGTLPVLRPGHLDPSVPN
ncbi:hypothetical protein JCM11251_007161 [Rhodosporidiobolus azoricus]